MKAVFQIVVAESKRKRTVMILKGTWHGINEVTGKYKITSKRR